MSISVPVAGQRQTDGSDRAAKTPELTADALTAALTEALTGQPVQVNTANSLRRYWRKVWLLMAKDLRIELRAKEVIGVMLAFTALSVIIFGLAFDLRVPRASMVVPGVLWGVLLFSGILGLNRSFSAELDRHTLIALLLAPVDRSALYLGKFLANLLFMGLMTGLLLPVILFIFDVNLFHFWIFVALALGILGYTGVGVLFAALTVSTRARESLLPILLLPIMAPVFMAGLKVTEQVLDGRVWTDFQNWLGMLVAFDCIFLTAAFLVFDLIWEDL
ncbi:MAG: heme exporter protein CcmB [Caldilineaceae bacterium]